MEGRTTATVVVLVVSLWTVVILARPLTRGKALLVAALVGAATVVVAVPAIRSGLFLMSASDVDLAVAGVVGGCGAVAVELVHRAVQSIARRHRG